jgi:thiamine kinase-like enzyme
MVTQAPGAEALAFVPGVSSGARPLHIARLEGGSVNDVWRVDMPAGRYVLRVDGAEWRRPGVNRVRESALHQAAADAGLAPRILAQSPALDIWVMDYIDGARWSTADFADGRRLTQLGELLARLQRLPPPGVLPGDGSLGRFNPVQVAREYARRALQFPPQRQDCVNLLQERVLQADWQLTLSSTSTAIVHGDPTAGNVLGHERLWLIDWEYAQVADPVFDVAAVLVYQPEARAHMQRLLRASGQELALRDGRLKYAAQIHDALHWLWRMARGENVPEDAGISQPEWAN